MSVTALGTSGMAMAERPVFVLPRGAVAQPSCRIFSLSPISVLSPRDGLTLVEGRALLPNGEGAPGVRVGLRSSAGAVVAILSTDSHGRFAFRRPIVGPSSWRLLFIDHPGSSEGPREFVVRPRVVIRPPKAPVGSGRDLTVRGHLEPRLAEKLVQLEFQAHGAWRPVIQSHTRLGGAFVLRYRFSAAPGRYKVRMRVAVPRDRGWPGPGAASRPFTVKVNG